MFKELQKGKKLYRLIVEQIIELIDCDKLKCGDKLPSERELSNDFGVSRSTIREAISALDVMGIVEVKSGLGTFVRCEPEDEIANLIEDDGISPTEIFEVRIILEPQIAKLASLRATAEDLNMLKIIIDKSRVLDNEEIEEFEMLDEQFHLIIAQASYNDILIKISQTINNLRNSKLWGNMKLRSLKKDGIVAKYKKEHEEIYEALISRDFETVELLTKHHLVDIRKDIFEENE